MQQTKNKLETKISVIIPVYNKGKYLARCLDSVLKQTYTNFEIVAIDDCSTDNSLEILKEYEKKDPRIKLLINKENLGVCLSSNKCIDFAKGQYIARLDADDIMPPTRLATQYKYLTDNEDVTIVGGHLRMIDNDDNVIFLKHFPLEHEDIKKIMFILMPIQQGSMMVNRVKLPTDFVWYDKAIPIGEDLDLIFRLLPYGKMANLDEYMLDYRMVDDSLGRTNIKETFKWLYNVRVKAIKEYNVKPSFKDKFVIFVQRIMVYMFPRSVLEFLFFKLRKIFI